MSLWAAAAQAAIVPTYSSTFGDAVTGDNQFEIEGGDEDGDLGWFINSDADNYGLDKYERPVIQSFTTLNIGVANGSDSELLANVGEDVFGVTGSNPTYFEYLDIVEGQLGFSGNFLFFRIKLFGEDNVGNGGETKSDFGESSVYRVRLSENADGSKGVMLSGEAAADYQKSEFQGETTDMFTDDQLKKAAVYEDEDGDIGTDGNGYELQTVDDGLLKEPDTGDEILYTRKVEGEPWVEFAFNYVKYNQQRKTNLDPTDGLPYLVFEANRGLKDNGNYLWNDEYTLNEAGTPYVDKDGIQGLDPFANTELCEGVESGDFPCNNVENIYELDTLMASTSVPMPEPGTLGLFGLGLIGLGWRVRRSA